MPPCPPGPRPESPGQSRPPAHVSLPPPPTRPARSGSVSGLPSVSALLRTTSDDPRACPSCASGVHQVSQVPIAAHPRQCPWSSVSTSVRSAATWPSRSSASCGPIRISAPGLTASRRRIQRPIHAFPSRVCPGPPSCRSGSRIVRVPILVMAFQARIVNSSAPPAARDAIAFPLSAPVPSVPSGSGTPPPRSASPCSAHAIVAAFRLPRAEPDPHMRRNWDPGASGGERKSRHSVQSIQAVRPSCSQQSTSAWFPEPLAYPPPCCKAQAVGGLCPFSPILSPLSNLGRNPLSPSRPVERRAKTMPAVTASSALLSVQDQICTRPPVEHPNDQVQQQSAQTFIAKPGEVSRAGTSLNAEEVPQWVASPLRSPKS